MTMNRSRSTMRYRNRNIRKDNDSRNLGTRKLRVSTYVRDVWIYRRGIKVFHRPQQECYPSNTISSNANRTQPFLSPPSACASNLHLTHRRPPRPAAAAPPTPILSSMSLCLSCAVTPAVAVLSFPFAPFAGWDGISASGECSCCCCWAIKLS